jgi:CheY-like chemotaxis protein
MRKILIIEDESHIRGLYKQVFENASYEVEETDNCPDAIKLLRENTYDVVLLDLLFTNQTDGFVALREARKENSPNTKTPIVVITNLSEDEKIKKALKEGADKCLFKAEHTPKSVFQEVDTLLNTNKP